MDTQSTSLGLSPTLIKRSVVVVTVLTLCVVGYVFHELWVPRLLALLNRDVQESAQAEVAPPDGAHAHNHAGHDEGNSLELSAQARRNVGLTTAAVKLQTFVRHSTIPAIVIGRPGRAAMEVTATLGGRVTRVYPVEGEAVEPGQPLFDLRLTHEELVQAQSEFLRTAEELDVVAREIQRIKSVNVPGAIPGKTVRLREYEEQKLKAVFNSQNQSLLLHGLTTDQVASILKTRTLVQGVTVVAPEHPKDGNSATPDKPFTVRNLHVKPGQYVDAGAPLCQLMDYGELYIQGRAFEQDSDELLLAAREQWDIVATRADNKQQPEMIKGLKIVYLGNEVDPESRALHFYVRLPNKIVYENKSADGHRFLTWRYKPGQRMQLRVPVEQWTNRIVLPIDAVAKEGVEYYVFQQNGDHFDRVPVQVEYQDQFATVIANDGSVFPGDIVATSGAHQLQMALKNKAGGGVDPHAGHNH